MRKRKAKAAARNASAAPELLAALRGRDLSRCSDAIEIYWRAAAALADDPGLEAADALVEGLHHALSTLQRNPQQLTASAALVRELRAADATAAQQDAEHQRYVQLTHAGAASHLRDAAKQRAADCIRARDRAMAIREQIARDRFPERLDRRRTLEQEVAALRQQLAKHEHDRQHHREAVENLSVRLQELEARERMRIRGESAKPEMEIAATRSWLEGHQEVAASVDAELERSAAALRELDAELEITRAAIFADVDRELGGRGS